MAISLPVYPKNSLERQDVSLFNARSYGAARTDLTLQIALDDIALLGNPPVGLLWTFEDDGLWTLSNPLIVPANVETMLPRGVFVDGAGDLTLNGRLWAWHDDWYIGTGVLTLSTLELQTSGLDANALSIGRHAKTTTATTVLLTAVDNATVLEATGIVPQGARLEGVTGFIPAGGAFGVTHGLTGLAIGDRLTGEVTDGRWGSGIPLAAFTATTGDDFLSDTQPIAKGGAGDILVTALDGSFDSSGRILLTIVYSSYQARRA